RVGAGTLGAVSIGIAGCTGSGTSPAAAVPTATSAGAPAGGAAPQPAATASGPTPKYGGTFKTGTTTIERNLDPHVSNGGGGSHGASNCYNQLITKKWGPDVKPVPAHIPAPDLAESWTQPDDLTYLF